MKPIITFILALVATVAIANPGEISLKWNASVTPGITNYVLYAHTNAMTETNFTFTIRADTGTNLTATVYDVAPGQWYFNATAMDTNGVESQLSNVVQYEIPAPPASLRTIILQYSASVTNFSDFHFFKLRFP